MAKRICCVFVFVVSCAHATTRAESVDEIFLAQRQNFMRLKSISMIYAEDWDPSEVMRASRWPFFHTPVHLVFGFQKEGEKFRVDNALEGTKVTPEQEGSIITSILAFNLDKYQRYEKSTMYLRVQSEEINPFGETNCPLIMPYRTLLGLAGKTEVSYSEMQDAQTWDILKQHVKIGESATVEGHDCVRMDFSVPGRLHSGQIYWARDLGYYPVKFQLYDLNGKKLIDTAVKDVMRRDTTDGPIFIPMVLEETQWPETGDHRLYTLKFTVDRNLLSINEDIPDDVFTIPLHMVRTYEDMDNPKEYFSTEDVVDKNVENMDSSGPGSGDSERVDAETSADANASSASKSAPANEIAKGGQGSGETPDARASSVRTCIYLAGGIALLGVLALLYGRHRRTIGP
jgi:hypothetical protein